MRSAAPGEASAAARRSADGRVFPPRARHRARARPARSARARPPAEIAPADATSAATSRSPPTASASSIPTRAASAAVAVARALPARARRRLRRCRSRRSTASSRTSTRYTADDFVGTEGERQQLRSAALSAARALRAAVGDARLRAAEPRSSRSSRGIHCRVIRDFYHKYTVDEHTLLAIRGLESLWNPPTPEPQALQLDPQELRAPELLTLALLFHDVGKWRTRSTRRKASGSRAPHARSAGAARPRRARPSSSSSAITCRCRRSRSAATSTTRTSSRSSPTWSGPKSC